MAEDYTYEPVTDVTTLAARVAELETALREQCELAATLMQQRTELEAQLNATGFALANSALIQRVRELEAKLDAAIVGGAQLERENAELRARLGAIGDSREQLADVQHTIWAHWMNYMFTQGTWSDGTWTMPADKSQRWSRQMATPYSALTFEEQESDRHQADKVLAVLMQAVQP